MTYKSAGTAADKTRFFLNTTEGVLLCLKSNNYVPNSFFAAKLQKKHKKSRKNGELLLLFAV